MKPHEPAYVIFGYRPKYLWVDASCFFGFLSLYLLLISGAKIPDNIDRLPWLIDRLGAAVPVAGAATFLIEIGSAFPMWIRDWYKAQIENREREHQNQLKKAREEGYRSGREDALKDLQKELESKSTEPTDDNDS